MADPNPEYEPSLTTLQMSMSQGSPIITPVHIQQAKAGLSDAGIPVAVDRKSVV